MTRPLVLLATLALLPVAFTRPAAAQGRAPTSSRPGVDSLSAPPGYVREVFTYPRQGRLDPVVPPATIASRDAFPDITLSGILYDVKEPARSAAIVRVGGTLRRVIRIGDRIDQYRIVRIERTRVIVDVELLGSVRRIYLETSKASEPAQS